jgi:hypothetical protein
MLSLIKLARRSSRSRGSRTPRTCRVPSSTPINNVPPDVSAKATSVRRAPSGEDRSRLNSRVLPSGRLSSSCRSTMLGSLLPSRQAGETSEFDVDADSTKKNQRLGPDDMALTLLDGVGKHGASTLVSVAAGRRRSTAPSACHFRYGGACGSTLVKLTANQAPRCFCSTYVPSVGPAWLRDETWTVETCTTAISGVSKRIFSIVGLR